MEINQWVRVDQTVNVSPDLEKDNWYASKVLEVLNRSIVISMPERRSVFLHLQKGQKIRFSIPVDKGLYLSTCLVLDIREGKNQFIEVEIPQELVLVERRRFERIPSRLDIYYSEIHEHGRDLHFQKAYSLDLSGGGMRLELHRTFPQETILHLKFSLPIDGRNETFLLTGRIVRAVPVQDGEKVHAGIEFIDISELEQRTISQFIGDKLKSNPAA